MAFRRRGGSRRRVVRRGFGRRRMGRRSGFKRKRVTGRYKRPYSVIGQRM